MRKDNIRYIDLFSGIGGFREGLTRAGDFTCTGNCEIDKFYNIKHKIIGEIQQLEKPEQMEVLYRRYVLYQGFAKIAVEMGYNYNWCCHIHGEALKAFEKIKVRN